MSIPQHTHTHTSEQTGSNKSTQQEFRPKSIFQCTSDNFTIAAGSILFRLLPPEITSPFTSNFNGTLQICLLHHNNKWVLPKGRKDVNESIEQTALRETFEETGYPCEPLPCLLLTRAPNPLLGINTIKPHVETHSTEPFMVTSRTLKDGSVKVIFWYLTRVKSNSLERVMGTQMANEAKLEPHFVEAREAILRLTIPEYKNVATHAINLIENAMTTTDARPFFNS